MSDGSFPLQQTIVSILSGISLPLPAGHVHSPAPQDASLPYVEVGDSDTVAADVQCRDGLEETITIHVWTDGESYKLAKDIASSIREALHAQKLTVAGRSAALAMVRSTRVFTDSDGEAIHGVVTLSVNHFGQKE